MSTIKNGIIVYKTLEAAEQINTLQLKVMLHTFLIEEEMKLQQIAADLKVSSAAICKSIDGLEELGLMKRKKEEKDDRRRVALVLTNKGNNFLERVLNA